ncbi:hypothetical protein [Streptomyces sp. NPDC058861]|uniref:hypothetical protein n=1 Tax=Streptomyces sp. NPDC058861 TaxID=3346653 RepID=UPI00368B93AA
MTTTAARYAPPGAEFMDRLSTAAWVEHGPVGPMCRVLATPARPRLGESVEAYRPGLLGIAQGLGLGRGTEPCRPVAGLILQDGIMSLDYGHPCTTMNVDPPESWYDRAILTGGVHVAVGLTFRPLGGGLEAVREYLRREFLAGTLWTGTTYRRRSTPKAWLLLPLP